MLAAAFLTIALLLGMAVWQWLAVRSLRCRVADDLRRMVTTGSELMWLIENREQLADWQEVSESAMDESTLVVRDIHQAIASIPFGILEAIPVTRDTTRVVHAIHDVTAAGIYAGVGFANRLLGRRLRQALETRPESEQESDSTSGDQHQD